MYIYVQKKQTRGKKEGKNKERIEIKYPPNTLENMSVWVYICTQIHTQNAYLYINKTQKQHSHKPGLHRQLTTMRHSQPQNLN